MAFDGSLSATLSPTASDGLRSQVLSTSIPSLVSSQSLRVAPSQISKTYRQASQLFLTRRLPEALSTVLPLITPSTEGSDANGSTEPAPVVRASRSTRIKVWTLYLTILNAILELDPQEGKDAFGTQEFRALCHKVRDGDVWEEVVQFGYHGVEGDVDSEVVINLATLLLAHARTQVTNQKRLENYLAASNTPNLDISRQLEASRSRRSLSRRPHSKGVANGADTPRDLNARVKILELYTLHVLVRNNEWDYAREFISVSSVLDEERREAFVQALQSLQEEQQAAEQREREELQKQEEKLRKDIEEARRLRAENEARERRRLEEERVKREGSEVDYGIEPTHPARAPNKAQAPKNTSPPSKTPRPVPPTSKGKKTVARPSFGTRAVMIISQFRKIIEQMAVSLKTNPVVLLRLIAFLVSIIVVFSRKDLRERVQRILGSGWNKIKSTAGMGVKARTLEAVKGVGYALAAADDALVLRRGAHVRITDRTLAVALVAEPTDGDARLLAAHYEITVSRGLPNGQPSNGKIFEFKMEPQSVPEPSLETSDAQAQHKRKAASPISTIESASHSPKRAKTGNEQTEKVKEVDKAEKANDNHGAPTKPPAEAGRDRREMARLEEKKRGRRLLGGLMNTLSQAGAGSQFKKRQDIERRQQENSTSQRVEDDRLRMQRLAKLEATRNVEQLKFEEKRMKTRHADMIAKAHHLHTRARPKIYYLPWELSTKQQDIIKDQIKTVEQLIDKEVAEFREYKEKRQASLGIVVKPTIPEKHEALGKPDDEVPTDKAQPESESSNRPPSRGTIKVGPDKDPDRAEDVMIEEAEDTRTARQMMDMVDALVPNDPRVEHKFADLGGFRYHYMLAKPEGEPTATVFLIHGWPDIGMGWRYQVPFLLSLNLQVVVPDMLGYGQTDAPESHEEYTFKKMTAHIAELVKKTTDQPIILGGHDWGGIFVWRFTQLYPELVRCVFSVCVPYSPPLKFRLDLPQLVEKMPNFRYQLQLASGEMEKIIGDSTHRLRGFLNGIYGGKTPEGKPAFTTDDGLIEANVDHIGQSPLLGADMSDLYVREFSRHGMHGPCNWYRTRPLNGEDEVEMAKRQEAFRFPMPAMLLMADKDAALPLWMAADQHRHFAGPFKLETLTDCSHWAMIQKPAEVNQHIGDFIKSVLGSELKAAL
ncbi:hypothetical protein F5Y17DRAFT_469364 [Xylariaceae sp. FL0594]|nr:hypothetical protein F5Y17DRAFT_469364 [Xylariaceae sp. FL0594]